MCTSGFSVELNINVHVTPSSRDSQQHVAKVAANLLHIHTGATFNGRGELASCVSAAFTPGQLYLTPFTIVYVWKLHILIK